MHFLLATQPAVKPVTTVDKPYFVYIVRCNDGSLYTGVSHDVERRVADHNSGKQGAKYTRSRRPVQLVFRKKVKNRSSAQQEEWRIKQLSRRDKQKLITAGMMREQ